MKHDAHSATDSDVRAELAARKIVELINSRPVSPRQDEIVDIIKRLAVADAPRAEVDPLDKEYGPIIK